MMTDCRWWLSMLSNSRDMSCQGWDGWQWAGAAAAEDAIWQPFSGFADGILFFYALCFRWLEMIRLVEETLSEIDD
jgi:hypothetical protein